MGWPVPYLRWQLRTIVARTRCSLVAMVCFYETNLVLPTNRANVTGPKYMDRIERQVRILDSTSTPTARPAGMSY